MKRWMCIALMMILCLATLAGIEGNTVRAMSYGSDVLMHSSILIDAVSGKVLIENNADEQRPVASIVKLMTIYLTLKEIDAGRMSLDDEVLVSAKAAGMGGSQIFLDANSRHKVDALLKSVVIASANDSSLVLAEKIAGSESEFVNSMNATAKELGMKDTNYVNTNGLPAPSGYSTARDVAMLMSRLADNAVYQEYSKIWSEEYVHPSGRVTGMNNTNRLVRTLAGIECGKTGSTAEAGYCLAVSAKRGNMRLIAVVLKADSSKDRWRYVTEVMDWAYANYDHISLVNAKTVSGVKIPVAYSERIISVRPSNDYGVTVKKGDDTQYSVEYDTSKMLRGVKSGQNVGQARVMMGQECLQTVNLLSVEDVAASNYWESVQYLLSAM